MILFVFTFAWFHSVTRYKIEFLPYASFWRSLSFIPSPAPRLIFYHMLRFDVRLVSFFHPLQDWIFAILFVFMFAWFRSFTRFKIEFLPYASCLRSLGFILLPALRLNFYNTLRFYVCLFSFLHPLQVRIFTIRSVLTYAWFYSFTRSQIDFLPYASFWRSLGFIPSPAPRLIFYHTIRFDICLVSFLHLLSDWMFIIWLCFIYSFNIITLENCCDNPHSCLILITLIKYMFRTFRYESLSKISDMNHDTWR